MTDELSKDASYISAGDAKSDSKKPDNIQEELNKNN